MIVMFRALLDIGDPQSVRFEREAEDVTLHPISREGDPRECPMYSSTRRNHAGRPAALSSSSPPGSCIPLLDVLGG